MVRERAEKRRAGKEREREKRLGDGNRGVLREYCRGIVGSDGTVPGQEGG
jgi:hypothetical protein